MMPTRQKRACTGVTIHVCAIFSLACRILPHTHEISHHIHSDLRISNDKTVGLLCLPIKLLRFQLPPACADVAGEIDT